MLVLTPPGADRAPLFSPRGGGGGRLGAKCGQHSLTGSFAGCLHPVTSSQATNFAIAVVVDRVGTVAVCAQGFPRSASLQEERCV